MFKRVSDWLRHISRGWLVILLTVIFLLFTATVLPAESARMDAIVEGDSPDLSLWYGPTALYSMAEAFGPEGRTAYIRARFTFDLVWPLVYLAFLGTLISWQSLHAFPESSVWRMINLLPVAGTLFDYLENVSTSLVMARYPLRTVIVDVLAGGFTTLKWTFLMLSFMAVPVLAVFAWRRRALSKRRDA